MSFIETHEDRDYVIARRAMPDVAISNQTTGDPHVASLLGMTVVCVHCEVRSYVATLRLSREQNQARLNYAEAKQGRPKVNLKTNARIVLCSAS